VQPRLILASASPRRAHILGTLGVPFRVTVSEVDESLLTGEEGADAAERLARAKAERVSRSESLPVLGADTVVIAQQRILGKPSGEAEAAAMLRLLSGRTHEVVTGLCLASDGDLRSGRESTAVSFASLTDEDIAWYVSTGEPMDKAGAYHIDGVGAVFITSVFGSPSNVAGLPVRLLRQLAAEARVDLRLGTDRR
jgi:nucleoside triphosphate pyrophosphatase